MSRSTGAGTWKLGRKGLVGRTVQVGSVSTKSVICDETDSVLRCLWPWLLNRFLSEEGELKIVTGLTVSPSLHLCLRVSRCQQRVRGGVAHKTPAAGGASACVRCWLQSLWSRPGPSSECSERIGAVPADAVLTVKVA